MATRMMRLVLILKHLTKVQGRGGGFRSTFLRHTVVGSASSPARMMSAGSSASVQNQARDTLEQFHYRLQHLNSLKDSAEVASATSAQKATLHDLALRFCQLYEVLPSIHKLAADSSNGCTRKSVLEYLALKCIPTEASVAAAVAHYHQVLGECDTSRDDSNHHLRTSHAMARLREACEPQYESILRSLLEQNTRQGMQFLFSLRRDLLQWLAYLKQHHQQQHTPTIGSNKEAEWLLMHSLKQMDHFLLQTFTTWFAPGLLQVQRITYDTTPAAIIEAIAKFEAVHPMKNLNDLRMRLGPDRRVFGLFHPLLAPNHGPLVVLHVSLQQEIPNTMDQVHQLSCSTNNPRVATFYSISNLQSSALTGIGLGEYLIKEVVPLLQTDFASLETFVTLSPMPGFRQWLEGVIVASAHHSGSKFAQTPQELLSLDQNNKQGDDASSLLESLAQYLDCPVSEALVGLVNRLSSNPSSCWESQPIVVHQVLERLAARYLVKERRRRKPLDSVARFHVSNGAQVFRVNVGADFSAKGWRNSFGCMVNYRYILDELAENQARYEQDYSMPLSEHLQALL